MERKSEQQCDQTPPESKMDDFVEMLNNDPYLSSKCDPKTVDAWEKIAKPKSEEETTNPRAKKPHSGFDFQERLGNI